jgi:hypothetical protein
MKTTSIAVFTFAAIAAFAQNSSTTLDETLKKREMMLSETASLERAHAIRQQLVTLRHEEDRLSRMPGVHVKTPEDKLVRALAEEVLHLREQNRELQKQIAALAAKQK